MTLHLAAVDATGLHDLRRRVLRNNDPAAEVSDVRDTEPAALHLAGFLDDVLVACGSVYPSTSPLHPELATWQLRYLAVDQRYQSQGHGAVVLTALCDAVLERGAREIWANGRDTALAFYRREGWHLVTGSEHLSPSTGLPHTVIWKSLDEKQSSVDKLGV